MSASPATRSLALVCAAMLTAGCGAEALALNVPKIGAALSVVVEGPCPKLAMVAVGSKRLLVYGDDGYDIENWLPGERLAASEAIVELASDGAFHRRSLLAGLPTDARGYVPFDIELGGSFERRAWLLLVTSRYRPHGQGALFERTSEGFIFDRDHWTSADEENPVDLPRQASRLPGLPGARICETVGLALERGLTFVPLASALTPEGGVFVAGRCADERITNYRNTTLLVAHGAPNAAAWTVAKTPGTEALDGIINVALSARSDRDAHLVAYEPFVEPERRRAYLSHFDGSGWSEVETGLSDGLMSVASAPRGDLYVAGGRALYRSRGAHFGKVALPPLRFAEGGEVHVKSVEALEDGELWVGASYRLKVTVRDKPRDIRGGALFSTAVFPHPLYCDAREPADSGVAEVEGLR